jgi:ubiquitin carboxyl-terminal hydrolase 4/11/15
VALGEESTLVLEDCFRSFTQKEKLEKENSWYCNKCKDFKQATKQMEIYKSNKILVLAFKRFSRHSKLTVPVKYPIEGLNVGPYLLCK